MTRVLVDRFKMFLRPIRKRIRRLLGAFLFRLLKLFCNLLKPNIVLTYLNTSKMDGVGAQIQRILAIRSLAKSLNLGYLHTEINSLAIHPLDSYQNLDEMKVFLHKLNHEFRMQSTEEYLVENLLERRTDTLTFSYLFSCIFKAQYSRNQILLRIVEPYQIAEYDPDLYQGIRKLLPNLVLPLKTGTSVAVHYRRGVGGFAIQRGERISREIAGNYFAALVKEIIDTNQIPDLKLKIFTDAPTEDVVFTPPNDQFDLWTNSPSFSEGEMHVLGLNVQDYFKDISVDLEVFYGGDPLEVIKTLAAADHLILSRSSFGYVAAILNVGGKVYFPSQFWHTPLKGWRIIRESIYD